MKSPNPQLLTGQKTRLRAYQKADLDLAVYYLNDLETRSLMWPRIMFPLRKEEEQTWYESFNAMSDGVYHFAIERFDTKEYIGGCGIVSTDQRSRSATIGIFVGKPHQNLGFGTEATSLLVDFCFLEMNMNKVKLRVYAFNKRAIHCYQKIGFKLRACCARKSTEMEPTTTNTSWVFCARNGKHCGAKIPRR